MEMQDNYPRAYKEVIEILSFVPKESVEKIPQTIIDTFKAKMDQSYDFKVDINKSFVEQKLLDETKAIFANIFRDFWATPYQRERIELKEKYDRQKIEKEKIKKYKDNYIFNKENKENTAEQKEEYTRILPIEVRKEKLYEKLLFFFKHLFHIK